MSADVSFVAVTRNDDYGGNLLERICHFSNSILRGAEQTGLDVEIVFVEWNPPRGKDEFIEAMEWPELSPNSEIRVVTVPPERHEKFPNSDSLPVFEYIGKNVGIRHSRGEYVLVTNPDVVYNRDLMAYLSNEVSSDKFYRIDRYDVGDIPRRGTSYQELLDFCRENVYEIQTCFDAPKPGTANDRYLFNYVKFLESKAKYLYKTFPNRMRSPTEPADINDLYTHYAGDFLLASREDWEAIRGFPENHFNWHIDRLATLNLAASGLDQTVIPSPSRVYHLEHENMHDQRPKPPREDVLGNSAEALSENELIHMNGTDWGLSDENLNVDTVDAR